MKKFLIILLILFSSVVVFSSVYFSFIFVRNILSSTPNHPSTVTACGHGISMLPTIKDGQCVAVDTSVTSPKEGDILDIIVNKDSRGWIEIDHRLLKIDDKNCYWIEGDNKEKSYDSRNYGWVCPHERRLIGVIKVDN